MKKRIYGFSEAAAGEIGTLIGRARGGLIPNGPAKSRHRDNPPKAIAGGIPLVSMTVRPSGGYGPAFYATVALAADGSWSVTGANVATVIPRQT